MIYYKEEKKKLVIPSGFVMIPIECDEAIEQAREQGYQEGFADGSSATCDTEEGTYSLTDDFDGEETVFPSEGKTGFNKIVIVDDGYGDAKYDEGYADGLADCSGSTPCDCSSAVTEAYQSGITEGIAEQKALLSSTAITSNGTYTSENGWNSLTVDVPAPPIIRVEKRFNLESGDTSPWTVRPDWTTYMTDVIITDNGYGQGKYDEGYADGLAYCSGSTDCSSAITEAYQSGYTAGLADCSGSSCTLEEGRLDISDFWGGGPTVVYPFTADGFSQFTVEDTNGSYAHKHYMDGYNDGLAQCSGSSCLIEDEQTASLGYDWTGFTTIYPSQGYDGLGRVLVADLGYGQRKYDEGFTDGQASVHCPTNVQSTVQRVMEQQSETIYPDAGYDAMGSVVVDGSGLWNSAYTEGYNAAITANCGSAITEAYESGVTEGQGSIFSVKVRWFSENGGWNWEVNNHPPLFIVDESGVSHTLNYQYSQSPDMYRRKGGTETDTPTGSTYYYEYAGYLQDGAKYIQPYQVKIPMLNDNLWNNNISGLSVEINGEVIHNWQTGPYGDVYDDWQFGSGAWRFTPLATVVSDTYYDATHKMVTFYIQGQVPNNN